MVCRFFARTALLGLALAGTALLLPASPVLAAGCEGISNAFAYNECLAKQGPARSTSRVRRAGRGTDPEATVRGGARYAPGPADAGEGRGVRISRSRGRSSAVIDPWGALKRTFAPAPRKRRR